MWISLYEYIDTHRHTFTFIQTYITFTYIYIQTYIDIHLIFFSIDFFFSLSEFFIHYVRRAFRSYVTYIHYYYFCMVNLYIFLCIIFSFSGLAGGLFWFSIFCVRGFGLGYDVIKFNFTAMFVLWHSCYSSLISASYSFKFNAMLDSTSSFVYFIVCIP